jgi:transposase InsO family protein
MPWEESTMLDLRIRFVQAIQEKRESMSELCREFGIARKTGYKWLNRYRVDSSCTALNDHSRCPHNSPFRTEADIEQRVIELRRSRGWGARKLLVELADDDIHVTVSTLNRIIKRNDLIRPSDQIRPATHRFEYAKPNELWQVDIKGPIDLADGRKCYPLSILDDHSRYLIGLYPMESITTDTVYSCLVDSFRMNGLPDRILSDHGTPFWSTTSPYGLTKVNVMLMNQGIDITHSGIRHPQTQGKVERFHRTLQEAFNHEGTPRNMNACQEFFTYYRYVYDRQRPHEALKMHVPAEFYHTSERSYTEPPKPWVYPSDVTIARLNTQGCLEHIGQRLFVCEALASQDVGLRVVDGLLVAYFRDLLIREIRLDTRHGQSLEPKVLPMS